MSTFALFVALSFAAQDAGNAEEPPAATQAPAAAVGAQACPCEEWMGRSGGLAALGTGIALGVTSLFAFNAGFEAERQLRAGGARTVDEKNAALTQRGVAAWVAWPSAVLSVVGVVGGGWLLSDAEDGAQ